jgi:protein gp37
MADGSEPWPNVWIGTTCEDQEHADQRIPILLKIRARIRWLSLEPLLGPIELTKIRQSSALCTDALAGLYTYPVPIQYERVHWVVAGAESGHHARPCQADWLRAIREDCIAAGTAFFLKQAVWAQPITMNIGSRTKGKGFGGAMVEMPYLDGKQHLEWPNV